VVLWTVGDGAVEPRPEVVILDGVVNVQLDLKFCQPARTPGGGGSVGCHGALEAPQVATQCIVVTYIIVKSIASCAVSVIVVLQVCARRVCAVAS
jgi:hypothetical protein